MDSSLHDVRAHNPFATSESLKREYLNYLRDALPIHPTQVRLRQLLEEKIMRQDAFCREPMISAIPSWKPDLTPAELMRRDEAPRLHRGFEQLLQVVRPLYAHQVDAITKVQQGRNIVVATGTGSGKTECFLLPLIDAALRSAQPEAVQAIFVYPMNALANDQLDRMRQMLGGHDVTYGRYTGQTPAEPLDPGDPDQPPENERADRQSIQARPPQLLLTNFAMLEYLLLRPDDQQIFRHNAVKTIVLDEAHSYRGAQGIDISLLMRRLRQRFGEDLQFILTSATIGDEGPDADEKIAAFASKLTGASFEASDVIRGQRTTCFSQVDLIGLSSRAVEVLERLAGDNGALRTVLCDPSETRQFISDLGITPARMDHPRHLFFAALRLIEPLSLIHDQILTAPSTADELSIYLEAKGHHVSAQAIRILLLCAANAASAEGEVPLFPARIHHFFRGLQGVSVQLDPAAAGDSSPGGVVADLLAQEDVVVDEGLPYWPLYVCSSCGMPAVSAAVSADGAYTPPRPTATEGLTLLTWMPTTYWLEDDDPESDEEPDLPQMAQGIYEIPNVEDSGDLKRCPCCGATAGLFDSIMRRVATGQDAPTAVLAEELLRQLPESPEHANLPAGGRKLLAFSDSRQRAAFFAPYLSRTIADAAFVQPLAVAASSAEANGDPLSLQEWPSEAREIATAYPWVIFREREDHNEAYEIKASAELNRTDRKKLRNELAITAYFHLTATLARRNRLPALMLAAPEIDLAPARQAAFESAIGSLLPDASVRRDLIQRLLLLLLRRYAVTFSPFEMNRRDLVGVSEGPTSTAVHLNPSAGRDGAVEVFRWNPYKAASNRRKQAAKVSRFVEQVKKAFAASGQPPQDQAISDVLDGIWHAMVAPDAALMDDMGQGRFRLNADSVLVRCAGPWFRCDRCDARTRVWMGGTCEVFGCGGSLCEVDDADAERRNSRTVQRYTREPMPVRVLEHTAQLTFEQGSEYQKMFSEGRANVLSCSTTFEMGVDVGDLDTVFLRNVPRATSNYTQRVGRAGRRNRSLAHAVTFAQASPHDQHHYWKPTAIAAGSVPVPVVHTANLLLAQRHINAFLLGRFWADQRHFGGQSRWKVCRPDHEDGFFAPKRSDHTCPAARFGAWCEQELEVLSGLITPIIRSADLSLPASDMVTASSDALIQGENSVWTALLQRWKAFGAQAEELDAEAQAAWAEGQTGKAAAFKRHAERALKMRDELGSEDLIGFLSSRHWLPNYAFPQDSVRLLVRQDGQSAKLRLERDRSMGIIEYAPGAEVIVDGKLIRSGSLDLEKREPVLERFDLLGEGRVELLGPDATQGEAGRPRGFAYIEPRGFSTMVNEPIERPNLYRKRPNPNSPVFLIGGASDDGFQQSPGMTGVTTAFSPYATLFTANYGGKRRDGRPAGYPICMRCGCRVAVGSRGEHETSWGSKCKGRYQTVSLAHRFETAVLQVRFAQPAPPLVMADLSFWKTLSTALGLAASETLDIERGDLKVSYRERSDGSGVGELFIYDNIAGGAGYAKHIDEHLVEVLRATRHRLMICDNPDCLEDSSCYACLRSFENQFDWPDLRRNVALEWIETFCKSISM